MERIIVCIPARYYSTRLPGKPLLKINNKTIINHVYNNVKKLKCTQEIIVLTDDIRICKEVISFGGNCDIVNEECLNGTDRIISYLKNTFMEENILTDNLIVVNVQGDEPFIDHNNIQIAIDNYRGKKSLDEKLVCSTLFYKTKDKKCIINKSRGKIVLDLNNNIMYCSRNIIPSGKKNDIISDYSYNIHIGIFVFDAEYLLKMYHNVNTPLQLCEDIEWMKIIEQGYKINACEVINHEIGVDTIEDYNYLKNKYY